MKTPAQPASGILRLPRPASPPKGAGRDPPRSHPAPRPSFPRRPASSAAGAPHCSPLPAAAPPPETTVTFSQSPPNASRASWCHQNKFPAPPLLPPPSPPRPTWLPPDPDPGACAHLPVPDSSSPALAASPSRPCSELAATIFVIICAGSPSPRVLSADTTPILFAVQAPRGRRTDRGKRGKGSAAVLSSVHAASAAGHSSETRTERGRCQLRARRGDETLSEDVKSGPSPAPREHRRDRGRQRACPGAWPWGESPPNPRQGCSSPRTVLPAAESPASLPHPAPPERRVSGARLGSGRRRGD